MTVVVDGSPFQVNLLISSLQGERLVEFLGVHPHKTARIYESKYTI